MPTARSFVEDATVATATALPVPRGIAFRHAAAGKAATERAIAEALPGWRITKIDGLGDWFEAKPPRDVTAQLEQFWPLVRAVQDVLGIAEVDPLLLIANPYPLDNDDLARFALGFGREQFGFWGQPYDQATLNEIGKLNKNANWHLKQMNVPEAWALWRAQHGELLPGDGILVGHPDTGFSDHQQVVGRLAKPGRSFLRDVNGNEEPDARDTLQAADLGFLQSPGHGTSTASVIVSGERDETSAGVAEVFGVAPGARVLPLRVSGSVVHFDFENVGRAILHAVDQGADVISMSLGGPGLSSFVRACIARAHEEGLIVVAAAGNALPTTIFPAAFPEVVAVAATHAARGPWRFSGVGPVVDIAAPGEDVWCARAALARGGDTSFSVGQGTGTSFATACVAGLAALWLSHFGGREAIARQHYDGNKGLVPFAFQYALARTADKTVAFASEGRYGAGLADAAALLGQKPAAREEIERFAEVIRAQPVNRFSVFTGLLAGGFGAADAAAVMLTVAATVDPAGKTRTVPVDETAAVGRAKAEAKAEQDLMAALLGADADRLAEELFARIASDRPLLVAFQCWRPGESSLPLLDRLLSASRATAGREHPAADLSADLRRALARQESAEKDRLAAIHRGRLGPGVVATPPDEQQPASGLRGRSGEDPTVRPPVYRQLRVYAFDPSLDTSLETVPINQVTLSTRWEPLEPGPRGEYLEVVDIDPASGCAYNPVDLDHPFILGPDGRTPSEGDPQFHQQMVYAVAMNTIHRFELALGRPIFWAPLRPWRREATEERYHFTREALKDGSPADGWESPQANRRDRYVQRLRIYPHALREANAYYSPAKRALLFGYFPGSDDDTGKHYPGGTVFTCLSHDIIAHETTHALLDGMHPYFNEPSNEDVWAFHEAFADIVALFQHFTFPEVLRHQIANTRGDLQTDSLLARLAQELGQAIGGRGALRNALGSVKEGRWRRNIPDPRALRTLREPHGRGSILVAAVFDAFLALYNNRIADLLRIYTSGTGTLPEGRIHPDLVNRLANEATQVAADVLQTCIRAMDYVPPVDITFGEFLRALVTADYDLAPADRRAHRIAFIEAFRAWGIYPRDVASLSEDSLRWRGPEEDGFLTSLHDVAEFKDNYKQVLERLVPALESWQPGGNRRDVFQQIQDAQVQFHNLLKAMQRAAQTGRPGLPGLDLGRPFSVANLRPSRRIGQLGDFRTEMVVEVVQTRRDQDMSASDAVPYRGGATLVVDLQTWAIRYIIYKRLYAQSPAHPGDEGQMPDRFRRQLRFEEEQRAGMAGAAQAAWQGEGTDDLAA